MEKWLDPESYINFLNEKIERKDTTIKMLITLIEGLAKKYKIPLDEEHFAAVFLSEENLKW